MHLGSTNQTQEGNLKMKGHEIGREMCWDVRGTGRGEYDQDTCVYV